MHDTAYQIGEQFLGQYATTSSVIVEIGSRNVNGSLRDFSPHGATYIGLDFATGVGVDALITSGPLPIASGSADVVITSSVFEHDPFFWRTFLEIVRIVKPSGIIYINVPSNGSYHRFPTDNWRFYPDAGKALEAWSLENGQAVRLVESFTAERKNDEWNDFVAIFELASAASDPGHGRKYLSDSLRCTNVWKMNATEPEKLRAATEDIHLIRFLKAKADGFVDSAATQPRSELQGSTAIALPSFAKVDSFTYFGGQPVFSGFIESESICIGRYCSIGKSVHFVVGGNHTTETVSTFPFDNLFLHKDNPTRTYQSTHDTRIGHDVWIGQEAYIGGGVSIGNGAVVGARAVVSKDVPPYAVVVGNSARIIRYRFDEKTVRRLLQLAWWDWPEAKIRVNVEWFYRPVIEFLDHFERELEDGNVERDRPIDGYEFDAT